MYNLIDNYVFLFKEYCNYILTINTVSININTFILIFLFGWLTSLNPCSLSIIPIYISHVSTETRVSRSNLSALFILGVFTNFITIVSSIACFAQIYRKFFSNFNLTSGVLLIFLGINLLKIISISVPFANNQQKNIKSNIYLNSFIIGFSSGIVTSACNIPILVTLLTWLNSLNNYVVSFLLAITYVFGYSLSIFSASLITKSLNKLRIFNVALSWGTSFLGALLLSSGVFSLCQFFHI